MHTNLTQSLKRSFGFDQFRPGQEQVVTQLLNGQSSLAIFPTGSGKSLCYQLSALHLDHLTLVVSPLIALMRDQLDFLQDKGIAAASLDSTLNAEQSQQVMKDVRSGNIKILMVSVERFKNERFRSFIESVQVSMLVIDEAHCISEWGHNFRPDYLKLPSYAHALNDPLVLLLTATAARKVKLDMAQRFNIAEPHIVQTGFYRSNLDLSVLPSTAADKRSQLLKYLQQQKGAGLIYVTLQKTAEDLALFLQQNKVPAQAYHAGFPADQRDIIQSDFMNGKLNIVVATIAFGMGVDKANIRFVIHYDLPKSIESYSQEIGRAGRDEKPSSCTMMANLNDLNTIENFVYGDTPELKGIAFVLACIRNEQQNQNWEMQVTRLSNASNIRPLPLKTLLVQLELMGVLKPMYAYYADVKYKFTQPADEILALAQFQGERQTFLAAIFEHTRMKKVWGDLDFDALYQAYPTNRKRILDALEYLQQLNLIELQTKLTTDVYQVDSDKLADPKLVESLHQYFAEKEGNEIKRIASMIHFFELDKCLSRHLALYFDDQDVPLNCGHCSVCRGQVATLTRTQLASMPDDDQLLSALDSLHQCLGDHAQQLLSLELCCRYLAGIHVPIFTRYKVRQLQGFGLCQNNRYIDIHTKVKTIYATALKRLNQEKF